MIDFKDIQSHAAGLLEDHAYFTNDAVIEDRGFAHNEINAALLGRGFVAVVRPPLSAKTVSRGGSGPTATVVVDAVVVVDVAVNPDKNPNAANKDIYEAVSVVTTAILAYEGNNPGDRYQVADDAVDLLIADDGEFAYGIAFLKRAVIRPFIIEDQVRFMDGELFLESDDGLWYAVKLGYDDINSLYVLEVEQAPSVTMDGYLSSVFMISTDGLYHELSLTTTGGLVELNIGQTGQATGNVLTLAMGSIPPTHALTLSTGNGLTEWHLEQ